MFFDIETSYRIGKFWRPSYKASISYKDILMESAIICICWKWEGNKRVHSLEWDKGCDKELLRTFIKELEKAEEVVGHNGDRFDLKWIRTRALFHGLDLSPTIRTVDTLKEARKSYNLASNTLNYIGQHLGVGGKIDAGGMTTWDNIVLYDIIPFIANLHKITKKMRDASMKHMVKYCKEDVNLLERVYDKLAPMIKSKFNIGTTRLHCPDCGCEGHRNKKWSNGIGTEFVELRCKSTHCNKYFSMSEKIYWKAKQQMEIKGR